MLHTILYYAIICYTMICMRSNLVAQPVQAPGPAAPRDRAGHGRSCIAARVKLGFGAPPRIFTGWSNSLTIISTTSACFHFACRSLQVMRSCFGDVALTPCRCLPWCSGCYLHMILAHRCNKPWKHHQHLINTWLPTPWAMRVQAQRAQPDIKLYYSTYSISISML